MTGFRKHRPNLTLIGLRLNRGLSPAMLGHLIGVSAPTIRLAEKGHIPDARIQFALAKFFGQSVLDIWPIEVQREVKREYVA